MEYKIKIKINETIHILTHQSNDTVNDLKDAIRKLDVWKSKDDYIDLVYEDEIPIRGLGKYNIEFGCLLQMYDTFKLSMFNFETMRDFYLLARTGKKNTIETPKTYSDTPKKGTYTPPNREKEKEKVFIYEEDDFPPLG
jgi:hypothetical protein